MQDRIFELRVQHSITTVHEASICSCGKSSINEDLTRSGYCYLVQSYSVSEERELQNDIDILQLVIPALKPNGRAFWNPREES